MAVSFWGVDHGDEISKADDRQRSAGRGFLAVNAPGIHAPIAAKKGKKLRAFGNAAGGSVLGGTAGQIAGAALTRGSTGGMAVGGGIGGGLGAYGGYRRNAAKGYYKPLKG